MSAWTIEQAAALLVGEDPDAILDGSNLAASCPDDVRRRYLAMFRLLDSHIRHSGIAFSQPPTEIIEWALHAEVNPPLALVEAVRTQGRTLIETRTAAREESRPLGERERNTLLRMLIGMAIGGYGLNPDDRRSDVAAAIVSDLDELGIEISTQTVRDKLQKARDLLPGDWRQRSARNAS